MTLPERFGKNLARYRQAAGLTQEVLAEKAGLHRTEIGELENGKRVCRIDTLAKLCGALQIEAESLMEGIDGSIDGHLEIRRVFLDDLDELAAEGSRQGERVTGAAFITFAERPAILNRLFSNVAGDICRGMLSLTGHERGVGGSCSAVPPTRSEAARRSPCLCG